jgi:hypothetical protein
MDKNISLDDKKKFTEDHVAKLIVQNATGQYAQMLSDTTTAYADFYGDMADRDIKAAVQKSLTQSTDAIIADFSNRNTRLNLFLLSQPNMKGSVVYTSFFPQGVMPFTEGLTKGNVEQRMDQLIAAINLNTAVAGGAAVLTEYQTFKTSYQSARSAQLGKIGEVISVIDDRDAAELVLDTQLFFNLHTICINIMSTPERLDNFFNETIIRPVQRGQATQAPDPEEASLYGKVTGAVNSNSTTSAAATTGLDGVTVRIYCLGLEVSTDEDGNYLLPPVPIAANYDVEFSHPGYTTYVANNQALAPGQVLRLNVKLMQLPTPPTTPGVPPSAPGL